MMRVNNPEVFLNLLTSYWKPYLDQFLCIIELELLLEFFRSREILLFPPKPLNNLQHFYLLLKLTLYNSISTSLSGDSLLSVAQRYFFFDL